MLNHNEIVLSGGRCYLCATFCENRSRNATVRVWTDIQTNTSSSSLYFRLFSVVVARNSSHRDKNYTKPKNGP